MKLPCFSVSTTQLIDPLKMCWWWWWWWWIAFAEWLTDKRHFTPYFQSRPLSEILTIANLRHAANRVWTCAESEFRLWWMKLSSNDNHGATELWTWCYEHNATILPKIKRKRSKCESFWKALLTWSQYKMKI